MHIHTIHTIPYYIFTKYARYIYALYICIQGKGPKADNIVNSVHIKFQALDVSLVYYAFDICVYKYTSQTYHLLVHDTYIVY